MAALAAATVRSATSRGPGRGHRDARSSSRRHAPSTSSSSSTASRVSRCPTGETPFSYLSELCWGGARRRYHPLTSAVVEPARPRARRHRASRARRVLPHLLGPDAVRQGEGHPGPGPGQRDQLDRVLHARYQPGGADHPQPAVRAVHQPRPYDLPRRGHRLQLRAAGGGHPVHLRTLRPGAHGDGLQPRHVPSAFGRPRDRLRARVPAAAGRSRGEGARDLRQRHGPARSRSRRRLRRVLRRPEHHRAGTRRDRGDAGIDRLDGPAGPRPRRPDPDRRGRGGGERSAAAAGGRSAGGDRSRG